VNALSPWRALSLSLAAALLLAAAGCETTSKNPENGEDTASDSDEVRKVVVPQPTMLRLMEFVNEERLLLADEIVIDASADPFFMAVTTSVDPSAVEKIEAINPEDRVSYVKLTNRTGLTTAENLLPRITVGDGWRVVATKSILIRFHNRVSAPRPVFFDLKAKGGVLYYATHAGHKKRGEAAAIKLEIVEDGTGYLFRSDAAF
jgi:hypothetical protein